MRQQTRNQRNLQRNIRISGWCTWDREVAGGPALRGTPLEQYATRLFIDAWQAASPWPLIMGKDAEGLRAALSDV